MNELAFYRTKSTEIMLAFFGFGLEIPLEVGILLSCDEGGIEE
jgi:hypothetical protein